MHGPMGIWLTHFPFYIYHLTGTRYSPYCQGSAHLEQCLAETPVLRLKTVLSGSRQNRTSFLENKVSYLYQVLEEKEIAIERLRQEIEALRLVCQMVHEQGDSTADTFDPGIEFERDNHASAIRPTDDRTVTLARIRARLVDERAESIHNKGWRTSLLQFRDAALSASRALKRVFDGRSAGREPQRSGVREIFVRFGRSNAT